jgi:HEPN domain-containing protein
LCASQSDLAQTQEQFYGSCLPDIANGDYSEAFYDCNQVLQIALSGTYIALPRVLMNS